MKAILKVYCGVFMLLFALPVFAAPEIDAELPDLLSDDYLADDYIEVEGRGMREAAVLDPLEPMNRAFFVFNDKLYFWVFKPVETGYTYVVPKELRECFGNFFRNIGAPVRLINSLLQGKFENAGVVISRFFINSTVGAYGLADVAKDEWGLEPQRADFGQTLGHYGVGEGIYLCWPVLGPSSMRYTAGTVGDSIMRPTSYFDMSSSERITYFSFTRVNRLSLEPKRYEDLKKFSIDPYVSLRQAFIDYRRNMVHMAQGEVQGGGRAP